MRHLDSEGSVTRLRLGVGLLILGLSASLAVACAVSAVALDDQSEGTWVKVALMVAFGTGLWALIAPRSRAASAPAEPSRSTVLSLAGLVLLWSLLIRLGLTTPNLLTDGGSGFSRVLYGVQGFAGISYLLDLVLTGDARWDIWSAIHVTTALSALTPALVVLLARELGFSLRAAVLGGLALACLPLHAAMFSSDLIVGPAVAIMTAGLTLVAVGLRLTRASAICAGAALLSFVCWVRPEAVLVAGITLPVLWLHRRKLFHSILGVVGLGWLLVNAVVGFVAHIGLSTAEGERASPPLSDFLSHHMASSISMSWFIVAVAVGVMLMGIGRQKGTICVVVGVAVGLAPTVIAVRPDLTGNYMEAFRYGTWSLPFMAIAAGVTFANLAGGLSRVRLLARSEDKRPIRASAILALALAIIPLVHVPYLQRHYTHASEIPIILEAFELVPATCGVVVPEDDPNAPGTHETLRLYSEIAQGRLTLRGVVAFIERLGNDGQLPEAIAPNLAQRSEQAIDCWYFLETAYCEQGYNSQPLEACAELLDRMDNELVQVWEYEFINHRQVVRVVPDEEEYNPSVRVALYRLTGPFQEAPTSSSSE